jgi:8-hydroxy-5-deazaflavin:NADPH oxidoreductase
VARREELAQQRQTVAVIGGTGALGFGLALRWALAGVPIAIGSRSAERAAEAAGRLRERASEAGADSVEVEGLDNEQAAGRARTVVLAVPFRAQSETLNNLRYALEPGTVLVDATATLAAAIGGRATRTIAVWQGSAAQQAEEMAPRGVTVVSAFHTVSANALSDPETRIDEDVLIAGDDRKAKGQVAELVQRIPGLRAVDCGDLEMARIIEQLTALLISINKRYKVKHSGIRVTGLPADLPAG